MLAEFRVQPGCRPADLPVALVAHHVELAVIGPGSALRQVPGVAIGDGAGVLGELQAEHLCVQRRRLQALPRFVERSPRVLRAVGQLRRTAGIALGQRREELLGGRFGPVGFRRAAFRDADTTTIVSRLARRVPDESNVAIGANVKKSRPKSRRRDAETYVSPKVRESRAKTSISTPRWTNQPAAGARTTSGTAGKYAAISERDFRSAAVP